MKPKKLFIIFYSAALLLSSSCAKDFLEQPDSAVITIDSVFADPDRAMQFLMQVYGDVNSRMSGSLAFQHITGGGEMTPSMLAGFCDEGYLNYLLGKAFPMVSGQWGPNNSFAQEFAYAEAYQALRDAWIFIENADRVVYTVTPKWDWNEAFKNQAKSEAKFWVAWVHFEYAKRFGGIPIINKTPTFTQGDKQLIITPGSTRRSLRSTFDFILKMIDESIPYLPDSYPDEWNGRVTKGAALALKSKVLLFAASPLYNETPILSYGDARDSLLRFDPVDPNRWTKAKDAAQAAITWAETNGYELLDDPAYTKTQNYLYASTSPESLIPLNNEAILVRKYGSIPSQFRYTGGATYELFTNDQLSMGEAFVRKYFRTVDGKDVVIPDQGTFPELKNIFYQMEPRFHSIVWVPGYYYSEITDRWQENYGGRDSTYFVYFTPTGVIKTAITSSPPKQLSTPYQGFFYVKKWHQFINSVNNPRIGWAYFRLPELYLNYAEAANEVNPSDPNILLYLNKIRTRGGLPNIEAVPETNAKVGNTTQMREEIKRERAIELYGEEHRWFDVRRWKMAEVNGGPWKRIELYENGTGNYVNPLATWTPEQRAANDAKLSYRIVESTEAPALSPRVWEPKMYFYPWMQNEINKGDLVQNPGW
jgi:hypothetical protein